MGSSHPKVSMVKLREAIEASWSPETAYLGVAKKGNPALGNCYPTSRVVQHYFPKTEIVEGTVQTGDGIEKHFWNVVAENGVEYHIDLSWQQFPHGSYVTSWKVRDRETLGDGADAIRRVDLLLERVQKFVTGK
jgi:hypothetical protein